jgi:uncharacterized OB-fold protein
MPPELELRQFPGVGDGAALLPLAAADTAPFQAGLRDRRLSLQRCSACGRARYPVAPVCPWCATSDHSWEHVEGSALVFSWVRYQRPFHPAFAPLVPYVVVLAELRAGPRLFGRLRGDREPRIGMALEAVVERWQDGACTLAFEAREGAA